MNVQAALDAPRWCFSEGNRVALEQSVPRHVAVGLQDRGHVIAVEADTHVFGKGQMIFRGERNILIAASEPRADGMAIAW